MRKNFGELSWKQERAMRLCAIVLFSFGLFAGSPDSRASDTEFTVQSFNAYGPAYAPNLARRTELLLQHWNDTDCCDVLLLQEVWKANHHTSLARELEARGIPGVRFDTSRADGKTTGIATFVRGTIDSEASVLYPVNNQSGLDDIREMLGIQKGIGRVRASLTGGESLVLLDTHTHPQVEPVRVAQMLFLIERELGALPASDPVFLAGDFNATPDSLEFALLRDVLRMRDLWTYVNGGYAAGACTYCLDNPLHLGGGVDRVIDYVWFRDGNSRAILPLTAEITPKKVETAALSDHYGLRGKFRAADRGPSALLALDDPELLARLERAKTTLERARERLAREGQAQYNNSLIYIERLRAELSDPASAVVDYYRVP